MVEKKKKTKKKEVCNTFNISDGKKEETTVSCGEIEEKNASRVQVQNFSKTLAITLSVLGFLVILFFSVYYFVNASNTVSFKGTDYQKLQVGEVLFYHTQIPYILNNKEVKYNIYLRSNPKKIVKSIPLNGDEISWKQVIVTNYSTDGLVCEGDVIIAQANFLQVLSDALKLTVIRNETVSCDEESRYMYLNVVSGSETKIEKIGESCYNLEFANCEILPVTERFLLEAISRYNEMLK